MKKNAIILAIAVITGSFAVAWRIFKKLEQKKYDEEIEEFWKQEEVQRKLKAAEEDAIELEISLNAEADEYLENFKKELNDIMDEYFARQEEHNKRWNEILNR